MKASEQLRQARGLITDQEHWCQRHIWRRHGGPDQNREDMTTDNPPDQFCAIGALEWTAHLNNALKSLTVGQNNRLARSLLDQACFYERKEMFAELFAKGKQYDINLPNQSSYIILNDCLDMPWEFRTRIHKSEIHTAVLRAYDAAIQFAEEQGD